MPVWPNDYVEKVLKDIEKYNGKRKIVKAGLIERCAVRYCSPDNVHPNPSDEFSMAEIGPNLGIVSDYVELVKENQFHDLPIFAEPLIVQKMEKEGYLLLNGHHRWFAAIRMSVRKIHIQIVNLVSENDLSRMIGDTSNTKLVSFDFDEVLLSNDESNQALVVDPLFSRKIKERLRAGAPEVIKEFQQKGYDVCVYSSNYFTEEDFEDFFSMYDLKVNVFVNGVNEKRDKTSGHKNRIKDMLKNKYKYIVHVDNETVIWSDHTAKDYSIYDIEDSEKAWSEGIKNIINSEQFKE